MKQAGSMPGECRKPWLLSICSFAHLLPSRPAFLKQEWSLRVGYTLRCGFGIPCLRCEGMEGFKPRCFLWACRGGVISARRRAARANASTQASGAKREGRKRGKAPKNWRLRRQGGIVPLARRQGVFGRPFSTRRGLGLEALEHVPSVCRVWGVLSTSGERCRPLRRFDRLSLTTKRRLLAT